MAYEVKTTKIKFTKIEPESDGAGGFIPGKTKTLVLETFAKMKQIKASRVAENFQEGINSVYQIKLFKRAGFNPDSSLTVEWNGRTFSIMEIAENDKDNREWLLVITDRGISI